MALSPTIIPYSAEQVPTCTNDAQTLPALKNELKLVLKIFSVGEIVTKVLAADMELSSEKINCLDPPKIPSIDNRSHVRFIYIVPA